MVEMKQRYNTMEGECLFTLFITIQNCKKTLLNSTVFSRDLVHDVKNMHWQTRMHAQALILCSRPNIFELSTFLLKLQKEQKLFVWYFCISIVHTAKGQFFCRSDVQRPTNGITVLFPRKILWKPILDVAKLSMFELFVLTRF
jgi:hypothetical protein